MHAGTDPERAGAQKQTAQEQPKDEEIDPLPAEEIAMCERLEGGPDSRHAAPEMHRLRIERLGYFQEMGRCVNERSENQPCPQANSLHQLALDETTEDCFFQWGDDERSGQRHGDAS